MAADLQSIEAVSKLIVKAESQAAAVVTPSTEPTVVKTLRH